MKIPVAEEKRRLSNILGMSTIDFSMLEFNYHLWQNHEVDLNDSQFA
jgi:hypothetical protein